jgi:hypothetical protein
MNDKYPQPPEGWDKKPVHVQIENNERRITIKFPNIDAVADWMSEMMNKPQESKQQ